LDIINKLLKGIDEFPTLPTIYITLSEVMSNPYSTLNDAADIISNDQSSAAKILKTANSSIFGLKRKIDTIKDAIFYIGFKEVKNLILAMSVMDIFQKTKILKGFSPIDLWKHSIAVGVITRHFGVLTGLKKIDNYFITGILHDIGKLLFIKNIPEEYSEVIELSEKEKIPIRDAESTILGMTHNIAGELIAEKWKLPTEIKLALRYHNNGMTTEGYDNLTACVHLANITAKILAFGNGGDQIKSQPNRIIWDYINLPEKPFTSSYQKIKNDYDISIQLFTLN